jgi:hypothetical protein
MECSWHSQCNHWLTSRPSGYNGHSLLPSLPRWHDTWFHGRLLMRVGLQQDVQRTHTITLRRLVQPLLQWKSNKYYIFWVCITVFHGADSPYRKAFKLFMFPHSSHTPASDNAWTKGRNKSHEYRHTNGVTQRHCTFKNTFDFIQGISSSTAKLTVRSRNVMREHVTRD